MHYHKLSWTQVEKDTITAVSKIKTKKIDKIVSISRGGLVFSRIVSDLLNCSISHIVMSSYIGNEKQGQPYICELPGTSFMNQTVLIVDEVSDSGDTFKHATSILKHLSPKEILTFAPYMKPGTKYVTDYYTREIDGWIIFPYDIRETYDNFVKELGSKAKALKQMREVGFEDWEVDAL
jgi:hypothetical protein